MLITAFCTKKNLSVHFSSYLEVLAGQEKNDLLYSVQPWLRLTIETALLYRNIYAKKSPLNMMLLPRWLLSDIYHSHLGWIFFCIYFHQAFINGCCSWILRKHHQSGMKFLRSFETWRISSSFETRASLSWILISSDLMVWTIIFSVMVEKNPPTSPKPPPIIAANTSPR